jgi:DNA mismatch repair protein MutL
VHDFIRDTVRTTLMKARPAASFADALSGAPYAGASASLLLDVSPMPGPPSDPILHPTHNFDGRPLALGALPQSDADPSREDTASFTLRSPSLPPVPGTLAFTEDSIPVGYTQQRVVDNPTLYSLSTLKPLGQLRDSFILAVDDDGLWIIDQHVAHERVLFEKILASRDVEAVQRQRLLMPLLVDLQPWQMAVFADIADELERNGFEAEPFGPRTLAVKAAPVGLEGRELERMLSEVIEQTGGASQDAARRKDLATLRGRIAASIACHSAIKVNTPLESQKMDWLLKELSKTEHPTSCPHGRPIALRYSWREIQRAFQRI